MPSGPCPAEWQVALQQDNCLVDMNFLHDGVSIRPNCDGPTQSIRLRNDNADTWYALYPNKTVGDPWVAMPPFSDITYTGIDLTDMGLATYGAAAGIGLASSV